MKVCVNWFMHDFQLHSDSELKYMVRLLSNKGDRVTEMYFEAISLA